MSVELRDNEVSETYFFAQNRDFAPYYDLIEDILNPYIQLTHDLVTDLLVEAVKHNRGGSLDKPAVLVIGSGTGGEVLRIARKMPQARIVAVDFSQPMNEQLREKFAAEFLEREFEKSIDLLEADFLSDMCSPGFLLDRLRNKFGIPRFDAVVIGFVTHHYLPAQKLEFYRRTKSVLCEGGSLIHADLFNFRSAWLSGLAHDLGQVWIEQLTNPDGRAGSHWTKIKHIASRLRSAWTRHWNSTHIYSPMNGDFSTSAAIFSSHVSALHELGFSEIECPMRLWEVGVIWARL
jgi:hypothetical protein